MNDPIFHRFLAGLRKLEGLRDGYVLGLSGGVDSVALALLMREASGVLGFKLKAAHCFHGQVKGDDEQNRYRHDAAEFSKGMAKGLRLEFVCGPDSNKLLSEVEVSEAHLRKLRYEFFDQVVSSLGTGWGLALGHHRDDVLETRLINLIRGGGALAMASGASVQSSGNQHFKGQIIRPLGGESKADLIDLVTRKQLRFLEDPSNESSDPLRNWLRNQWLPELEAKRVGSVRTLARSLDHIGAWVSDTSQQIPLHMLSPKGLDRVGFNSLSSGFKKHLLLHYLHGINVYDLSQNQIDEVLKRLDSSQKELRFTLAGCQFETCKHWIKVTAPVVPYER